MLWNRIAVNWRQIKDQIVFRGIRWSYGDSQRFDLIGTEISRVSQSDGLQPAAFHPDDRGRRSEFSLHIGC